MFKSPLRYLIRRLGYDIHRTQPPPVGIDWIRDLASLEPIRTSAAVFDVGANVGLVSQRFRSALPASVAIHAFEPAYATFQTLRDRLAGQPSVTCHCAALSNASRTARLFHGQNSQLNRLSPTGMLGDDTSEEVAVSTVDAVCAAAGIETIGILKTDTEGFDVPVLQGARGMFERQAVRAIVSEATLDRQSDWHTTFDDIRDYITPLGFDLYGIYDCERWGYHLKYCNAVFVHRDFFKGA